MTKGFEKRKLVIDPSFRARAVELTRSDREGEIPVPDYIGNPGLVVISDPHAETGTYCKLYKALPGGIENCVDLGDKVDRGPNPLEMNYILQTLGAKRILGNHDAMWLAAGLGIKALAIELVRWLMRYDEINFLTSVMGIDLGPLREYTDKYFRTGSHRIAVKSKQFPEMEAAATYLKIIEEAYQRFPRHKDANLNDSEQRMRAALFFTAAREELTGPEIEIFERLTGDAPLGNTDADYFYRLMGGARTQSEEGRRIVDHFASEFLNNYSYYRFISWMVGEGDLFFSLDETSGFSCSFILTHAHIPIDESGELKELYGYKGKRALMEIKRRILAGMEAWRQQLEHDDSTLLEMHKSDIDSLGTLAWDVNSPLYGRQMQTAARAVLKKSTGTWHEQEEPFFTHFEKNIEPAMVAKARMNIADSFDVKDPDNYAILRGHKPSKDGMFQLFAGGTVINVDGGMAENYGGRGGAFVAGPAGAGWLSYPDLKFTRVPLPGGA